ncbi:MAG TPA: DNA repair exonuclease [Opitutus sp.]|nr:DNA repair exonuclease [Opitutus sp.]
MFRFIHTADWQLGARFSQFGAIGRRLREARLSTLAKALALARQHAADAFLIAGDLFEDNQVDDSLVAAVGKIFAEHPSVPIFILPGNHDPFTGPESVWLRKSMRSLPAHVHLLTSPGVTDVGGVFLLASPLQQKLSTTDPSFRFIELAASLPADAIKIGITHGALAIEGKHQPNDFPIALNAATRAGLDYLAIGHWHNWLADTDGGRVVMPGTPEPDRFANDAAGHVALVEIAGHGQQPLVKALPVNTLAWRSLAFDFLSPEAARASLEAALSDLRPNAESAVVRVTFTGTVSPKAFVETRDWVETALAPFLVGQIADRTRIALSSVELADLQSRHPLLAQTLADIDRLESLATGENRGVTATPSVTSTDTAEVTQPALTLAEVQALLSPSKIDLASLTPEFFSHLRQMLLQTLQEVAP